MSHATSTPLAALASRIRARQHAAAQRTAAAHGWQVRQVAPGTYRFRDPRFDSLTAAPGSRPLAPAGGHDA
jgi:hypothetical protein